VILEKTGQAEENLFNSKNGESLGKALSEGLERIEYYTGLQKKALNLLSILLSLLYTLSLEDLVCLMGRSNTGCSG